MFNRLHSILIPIFLIVLVSCQKEVITPPSSSVLTISCETDPHTLDPRQAHDLITTTAIYMLYEGLTRLNQDGKPVPAMAESITISPDQKTYTFGLRQSGWSNNSRITAHDFEQTWKSVLDPLFPAPNAYQFYVIKGARDAKQGRIPLDQVGIKAIDDYTLVVELERPVPYFLNLTASYFYYPVNWETREKDLNAEKITADNLITNGPFKLQSWTRHHELTAVTNPYYWDTPSVHLDKISFVLLDNPTALSMFDRKELEWTGSPLSRLPTDAIATLKEDGKLLTVPAAGVYLLRLNIEKPPLNQKKLRQALSLALNRKDLVEHVLQGNQTPTTRLVPPSFLEQTAPSSQEHYNLEKARQLFAEALAERHIRKEQLPPISLCYGASEVNHKIAQVAQQQWQEAFGIEIQLQSCESKVYYDRLKNHDYQVGIGSWFADFRDPISFLEIFKFKDNGTNHTQWENPVYIQLLDYSSQEIDPMKRIQLLSDAENILVDEMPVIPLFYASYNYLKQPSLKDVYFSEFGFLDFKQAYIE